MNEARLKLLVDTTEAEGRLQRLRERLSTFGPTSSVRDWVKLPPHSEAQSKALEKLRRAARSEAEESTP